LKTLTFNFVEVKYYEIVYYRSVLHRYFIYKKITIKLPEMVNIFMLTSKGGHYIKSKS